MDVRRARPYGAYTDALLREWASCRALFPSPATLFFGGGTPSLHPAEELARVVDAVAPTGEVAAEANPSDLGAFAALRRAGITRLSIGAQTFDPATAARLGRRRDAALAREAVAAAREAGFRSVNVDLIFAVPGQTVARLEADLDALLSARPDHVSLYGLTVEEGTAFARAKLPWTGDDDWRAMYDLAVERLAGDGLDRYEVSNFARAGHRCVHNEHYWRARPWAGLGAAAHGFWPDGTRVVNVRDVDAYVAAADPAVSRERPSPRALATELCWSTLRHVDGLDRAELRARTGLDVRPPPALLAAGLVAAQGDSLRLGPEGWALADGVARRLADTLETSDRVVGSSRPAPFVESSRATIGRE